MRLPPEILDNILAQISVDDAGRRTLIACALVATWLAGPSQRRLFSSVDIHEDNYDRWMNGVVISGTKTHLLEYVRSLSHFRRFDYRMRDLSRDSGEYFSALCNLRRLKLYNTAIEPISEEEFRTCFSAFRGTLTRLSLDDFTTSFSSFVALIDYFPNITSLRLRSFGLKPDEGPVPPLSRPLRGKLRIRVEPNFPEFLDRFLKLDLRYEDLVISTPSPMSMATALVESALQISTSTVKYLRLTAQLGCE